MSLALALHWTEFISGTLEGMHPACGSGCDLFKLIKVVDCEEGI